MFSGKRIVSALCIPFVAGFLLVGCGKDKGVKLGLEIPKNVELVKLVDIIEKPAEFNGKTVAMKGVIAGQCPSFCEFFFKDGPHQATIFPQGYKFPKLATGAPVTVYAQVTAGSENVVFSALGITTE